MDYWRHIYNPEANEHRKSAKMVVDYLMIAATQEDWDKIDNEIIPEIAGFHDEKNLMVELFKYVGDGDPNKRDAIASSLGAIEFSDDSWKMFAISKMIEMATCDKEIFPAGRAAMFLDKYTDDEKYSRVVKIAMENFVSRARENAWVEGLEENIPGIGRLF